MEYPSLDKPTVGAFRFNTDSSQLELYDGLQWTTLVPIPATNSARLLIGAGEGSSPTNKDEIEMIDINSTGNSVEFGELKRTNGFTYIAGLSDRTRACWGGGYVLSPATQLNSIEYFQMNSSGTALDFGDLTVHRSLCSSLSDSHGGLGGF